MWAASLTTTQPSGGRGGAKGRRYSTSALSRASSASRSSSVSESSVAGMSSPTWCAALAKQLLTDFSQCMSGSAARVCKFCTLCPVRFSTSSPRHRRPTRSAARLRRRPQRAAQYHRGPESNGVGATVPRGQVSQASSLAIDDNERAGRNSVCARAEAPGRPSACLGLQHSGRRQHGRHGPPLARHARPPICQT
jgi:hypothetical protein